MRRGEVRGQGLCAGPLYALLLLDLPQDRRRRRFRRQSRRQRQEPDGARQEIHHQVPRQDRRQEEPAERSFCSKCGSALWVWDPRWPELIHPFASAIDSKLPKAPEHAHILLDSKADWVPVDAKAGDQKFDEYPDQSLEDWHRAHGLLKKA